MYIAHNELVAFAMYSKARLYSTKPLSVVAMEDAILPSSFSKLQDVMLINSKDSPLSLNKALSIYKHSSIIENSLSTPIIKVLCPNCEVTAKPLDEFMAATPCNTPHLRTWIANDIAQLQKSGESEGILELLSLHKMPTDKFDSLLSSLTQKELPLPFIASVNNYNDKTEPELFLSNGNSIRKTPAGIMGRNPKFDKVVLSNVVIDVHKKYITNADDVLCDCTLTVGPNSVNTILNQNVFNSAIGLSNAISKAFIKEGLTPKLAVYHVKGFNWAEIRDTVLESISCVNELTHLGVNEGNVVDFPKCRIGNTIEPQAKIFSSDSPAYSMYAGLNISQEDQSIHPFECLWRNTDSTSIALAGCISHILHCIGSGVQLVNKGTIYPAHLILVRNTSNTLESLFSQLVMMFSGDSAVSRLPFVKPLGLLEKMKVLGTLPFMSMLPEMELPRQVSLFRETPVSLISCVPEDDCGAFEAIRQISYILSDSRALYDDKSMTALQQSLPYLIQRLMKDKIPLVGQHPTPALTIHSRIADFLHVPVIKADNVIKPYHIMMGAGLEEVFFSAIKSLMKLEEVQVKRGKAPKGSDSKTDIYVTDTCVHLPRRIISMLNRRLQHRNKNKFNADIVEYHLTDKGMIVDKNFNFWILPRDLWDKYTSSVLLTPDFEVQPDQLLALN